MPKGWKNIKELEWVNKKSGQAVNVGFVSFSDKNWLVEVSTGGGRELILEKSFNTKPQALRFANKYMREHPRG